MALVYIFTIKKKKTSCYWPIYLKIKWHIRTGELSLFLQLIGGKGSDKARYHRRTRNEEKAIYKDERKKSPTVHCDYRANQHSKFYIQ